MALYPNDDFQKAVLKHFDAVVVRVAPSRGPCGHRQAATRAALPVVLMETTILEGFTDGQGLLAAPGRCALVHRGWKSGRRGVAAGMGQGQKGGLPACQPSGGFFRINQPLRTSEAVPCLAMGCPVRPAARLRQCKL
jgi:hypothetical protein